MDAPVTPLPGRLRRDRSVLQHKVAPGTFERVLRFALPYRRLLAFFLAAVVADALVVLAIPLILRSIIDNGIADHRTRLIVGLALLAAGLAVCDSFLTLGQRYLTARVGEDLIRDLRTRVFSHVLRMPLAFFTRTQTGSLVSRLNADVMGAQTAFTDFMSNVIGNLVIVVFVLAVMFTLSWPITLLALAILPVLSIPVRVLGRRLAALARERYEGMAAMTTMMTERFNVAGALLVKVFGDPDQEAETFAGRATRVRDAGVDIALVGRVFFVALTLAAGISTALVYGWGGVLTSRGTLQLGTVVALAAYLGRLYGPLGSLAGANIDVMTTLVTFERVFEVLDLAPSLAEDEDAVAIPRGPVTVEFDDVTFAYPPASEVSLASLESVTALDRRNGAPVLRNVTFTIEPGALVALVGRSGAGKSTIGMLVLRLYDASSGVVRVDGVDVRHATLASLQAKVGVVTQDPHLFHETLRANLLYARADATEEEVMAALADAQLGHLVGSLADGLDTVVGDRGHRLSGGEKQRVAIARLILKAPDLVVLDEATAHLDSETEQSVQRALQVALAGRTSLVIAHRLSTVQRADCILVVEQGRIIERGTHSELLAARGLYSELYRTQFEGQVQDA
jgi:ATP-binding cassette subfamily B protein